MGNIAGYIANLGKSVSYAAVDKVKNMSPSATEFVSTNSDLFKSVYSTVRNYKVTYKRGMDIFTKSKIYEAGETLKTSLIEDIKSGKLYNKERENSIISSSFGSSGGGGDFEFDESSLNIDFDDFGGFDIGDDDPDNITTGDKVVSNIIDKSSRKSAEMISMTTARTGEYIVENQKMGTNLLYTQGIQTHAMLQGSLTTINDNISSMINFSDKVLKTHVDNSAKYYEETTNLLKDQTALLRELVGYIKPPDKKEKEKEKLSYDDIVGSSGTPDLKMYYKNVVKNITSNSNLGMLTSMNSMFGDDSNVLAMLAASPLKFIPEFLVKSVIPKTIENSMQDLDKSIGSIFGSLMLKFNSMASSDSFIESTIGKTLGIRSNAKKDIDTSKYDKNKVDWDGKSRKALIEVIPTQLGKIVSLLSGESEKIFDYDKGKFVKADTIKDDYNKKVKSYSDNATADMREFMEDYMKLLTFNSIDERKALQKDIKKFFDAMYNNNKLFDINSNTLDDDHTQYGVSSKNFRVIRGMFKNAPKHMQHSINAEILDNRNRQTRDFENIEKDNDSIYRYMYNNSNIDEFIKKNKLEKTSSSVLTNSLNVTKDKFGHNIFYYLQNIYKELSFMRQYGKGGGTPTNNTSTGKVIISSDNGDYSPEEKTINSIKIARDPNKPKSESDAERKLREEQRFARGEKKRREKEEGLINYSSIEDDKELENAISSKIKTDQVKNRLKMEEKAKPSIIDKLLEAENISDKTKLLIDKINDVSRKPVKFITSTIEKVDQRMYEFIYGKEGKHGKDVKGFLDLALFELKNTFRKFNSFLDDNILTPLKDKLKIDSFKEGFKELLSKFGVDTDKIGKSIKTFFVGDKETGESGILTSTIDATKNIFKNGFNNVKDSLKSTLSPISEKLFGGNKFKNLDNKSDNEDEDDEYVDWATGEVRNTRDGKHKSSIQQRIDDIVINANKTGKTQEYYDSLSFDSEEDKLYFAKNIYAEGQQGSYANTRLELTQLDEKINHLKRVLNQSRGSDARRVRNQIRKLEDRKKFLKNNLAEYYRSENIYKNNLKEKKYSNINDYYKTNISSSIMGEEDKSLFNDVIDNLFEINKSKFNGKVDFTVKDLMQSARDLSLDKDEKYESILDKIAEHVDKYYNEDIDVKLSKLADDSGKLIDPDNWYRTEGLPTTSEEFYKEYQNLIYSDRIETETAINNLNVTLDNGNSIVQQISDDIRYIKDTIFRSINNSSRPSTNSFGPRLGLDPNLVAHPEGGAIQSFSQDLVTMISNWMFGNIPKYDKGGYINETTVATIGKGEVVLSADNVEKLNSIMAELVGDIKEGKKPISKIANKSFRPLLNIFKDKENINSAKDISDIIKSNSNISDLLSHNNINEIKDGNKTFSLTMDSIVNEVAKSMKLEDVKETQAEVQENKSFVSQMTDQLAEDFTAVRRSLFGNPDEDSKKFEDVINDLTQNVSKYAPNAIGSGLLGAGISLVTGAVGGPLVGAAIGAGYSLTKNSDKAQNFLFGESINGERQGGLISKNIIKAVNKYFPDMKTLGITGALAGLFTPLGPIGGLLAGSALGFAKNNEGIMKTLFGEDALFKSESKDKLKKVLPKVALGALAGGMFGPFGLMGNLILGSGVGLVTSTDKFKEAIFGVYDEKDNTFKGGLLPAIRETMVKPLKDFAVDIKNNASDFIREHMLLPLTSAFDPIKKEISLAVKGVFEGVGDFLKGMFEEKFAPISKWLEDKIMKPLGRGITGFIKGAVKVGIGASTLPFKAIGGIGNSLRKKHIKNGDADYMTAAERLEFADEKGFTYKSDLDNMLNSMTDSEASELFKNLSEIDKYRKSTRNIRKDIGKETGSNLSRYLDYNATRYITEAMKTGDLDKAKKYITDNKRGLFGKKVHDFDEERESEVLDYIETQFNLFQNADTVKKTADKERKTLYTKLNKLGFDINDKNIDRYLKMIDIETKTDKLKDSNEEENITFIDLEIRKEQHNEIVSLFEQAINAIKGVEENTNLNIVDRVINEAEDSSNNNRLTSLPDVVQEANESNDREKSSSQDDQRNLIQELADAQTMTQVDPYGNVIELIRTSDGELEPNMSDSSTAEAIRIANEEREERKGFFSKFSSLGDLLPFRNKKGEDDEEDDKKKKGLLGRLFDLIPGGAKSLLLGGAGLIAAPAILDFAREKVLPFAMDMWNTNLKPWIRDEGIPLLRTGLIGVMRSLPKLIVDGIKFTLKELLPAFLGGVKDLLGFGKKDSIGESITDTAIREMATGGRVSKAGLKTVNKMVSKGDDVIEGGSTMLKASKKIAKIITNPLKLANPIGQVKFAGKLAGGITKTIGKIGYNTVGKVAEGVNSIYNKIDNITIKGKSLKGLSNTIKEKFGDKTKKVGEALIESAQNDNMLNKALSKIHDVLMKFLASPGVQKVLGTETAEKLAKKFVPNFVEKIGKEAVKNSAKIGAKVAGIVTTGGLINIGFAVIDFVKGYNDAQNILGIVEEPNLGMRIASGLIKAITGLNLISSLVPEKVYVDILLDTLYPIIGKNDTKIQNMRKDAEVKVAEYKKENKIEGDFTIRDYNNKIKEDKKKENPADRNGDGKVSLVEKAVNFGSNVVNSVKNFGKKIGNGVKTLLFGKGEDNIIPQLAGKGPNDTAGMGESSYPTKVNNFTYFSQKDPQWNKNKIGNATVKDSGCGPTSMSMIVSELTGTRHTPDEFATQAYNAGVWDKNGAQWTLFKFFADKYGLPYQEVSDFNRFQELAKMGVPQAVSGKTNGASGTPFTNGGHIISVLGTDSNGRYIVNDPVSPERSTVYSEDKIKVGWRHSWGFGQPGTYDGSGIATPAVINNDSTATSQPESGVSALISEFTDVMTGSFDKMYKLDTIGKGEYVGKGGNYLTEKTDINPLLATDYDDITVNKIKSKLDKSENILDSLDPYQISKTESSNIMKDILKNNDSYFKNNNVKLSDYTGQGGVDDQVKTVKTIKNIPIGSKPLNDKVQSYDSIFKKAGAEFGVDPELLKAICMQESKGEDLKGAARGLMQIENNDTTEEFINFGRSRYGATYTSADRSDPNKAIPFAANRLSSDFKHYNGDYLKTTQAYNFSKFSLDKLLKAFPEGDTWLSERKNMGKYNGQGPKYGDPKYIENVFQYYQGNSIPSDGIGTVTGGSGISVDSSTVDNSPSGFDGLVSEFSSLFTNGFNKLYGLDELFPGTTANSSPEVENNMGGVGELDPNAPKVADEWFTRSLNSRVTSVYGPRIHPIKKVKSMHTGIDYATAGGTPILSPVEGVVRKTASANSGYGNRIEIQDTMGGVHLFAHMKEKAKLNQGDKVNVNTVIGKVGTTGSSTGNHLHYEVRQGSGGSNDHVEPNSYLNKYLSLTKSNNLGKGGVDKPLKGVKKKYTGQGGVDKPLKTPKIKLNDRPVRQTTVSTISENNSGFDSKLISVIIEILSKIANNTSCLTDIVKLLSNTLGVDIPKEKIKELENSKNTGNKQIITMIRDSVKNNIDPGNDYLLKTLDQLAME